MNAQEGLQMTLVTQHSTDQLYTLRPSQSCDIAIPAIPDRTCEPPKCGCWLVVEVDHPENVCLAFCDALLVQGIDGQWRAWVRLDGVE